MRTTLTRLAALPLAALPLLAAPALAQEDIVTEERVAACLQDRAGEGCATVLIRVLVCAQAAEMPGCEEVNEFAAAAAEEDIEPDVDVRAEGELVEPADEDEDAEDDAETAEEDAAEEDAAEEDAAD